MLQLACSFLAEHFGAGEENRLPMTSRFTTVVVSPARSS